MLVPAGGHLLVESFREGISISVRTNDSFEVVRVAYRLNARFIVFKEIVVAFYWSWLLVFDHDISNGQEEVVDS